MKVSKMLALLALLIGVLAISPTATAEGWFSDMDDDVKDVTLGQVLRDPHKYVDVGFRTKIYFDRTGTNFNPYFTRFSDVVFGNFSAWPIDARLYEKRDFSLSYPFFYVQRTNKLWDGLSTLKRITPIEVLATVREVFRGQAWIEVVEYDTESKGLRKESVENIVRGDVYYARGRYKDAVKSYDKLSMRKLPDAIKVEVYRKLADAEFHAREYGDAMSSYRSALKLAPKNRVLEQGLAAATDMKERTRYPKIAKKRAGIVVSPASRDELVSSPRNDVDDVIASLRLDQRPAKKVETPGKGEVAVVAGEVQETDAKEAAVDDQGSDDDVVVKDGEVVEPVGDEPEGEEGTVDDGEEGEGEEADAGAAEKDGCGEEQPVDESVVEEDGCGEEIEEEAVEEEGCGEEQPVDDENVEETENDVEEDGCGEEAVVDEPDTEDVDPIADGEGEEVVEGQDPETDRVELVKDEVVREGEILVEDGERVVEAETVEEEIDGEEQPADDENAEEAVEEDACGEEQPADDESVEETEEIVEEEGCGEEQPADEESVEEAVDEDACGEEQPADEDIAVNDGDSVVIEDGKIVVVNGEAVVESGEDAVPAHKTVDKLPRLPFFGCEDVTEEQFREIIETVLNSPESSEE